MELRIGYLYSDLMNIYGDRGNVITLIERCHWRGIDTKVTEISIGDDLDPSAHDLYFFGGGQDREQIAVAADLQQEKGEVLRQAVENGAALLSICGGYQLLARYYQPFDAARIPGVGLFDAWTEASYLRMIGNLLITISPELTARIGNVPHTLIGFENHSGKTYLGTGCKPLGRVMVGYGNNSHDKTEGAVYKHAIGCYLHGSLLPKNPHLADMLIVWGLTHHYGEVDLSLLDDSLEWHAHHAAMKRAHR